MTRYAVVIENSGNSYSAHVPGLPGCVAAGDAIEETDQSIHEAMELHVAGLREDGLPLPEPASRVDHVEVAA